MGVKSFHGLTSHASLRACSAQLGGDKSPKVQKCLETGETTKPLKYGKCLEMRETKKSLEYGKFLDTFHIQEIL